ncbi:hypothetical protein BKA70DRAFT_592971 [Coprinopsis sp. MPI-PUGE-AT-0042]|nr:hypothetical protein BKA70DRAFT_592971 [Coprinopsis sp. MPI-PUGE-AT-0042]
MTSQSTLLPMCSNQPKRRRIDAGRAWHLNMARHIVVMSLREIGGGVGGIRIQFWLCPNPLDNIKPPRKSSSFLHHPLIREAATARIPTLYTGVALLILRPTVLFLQRTLSAAPYSKPSTMRRSGSGSTTPTTIRSETHNSTASPAILPASTRALAPPGLMSHPQSSYTSQFSVQPEQGATFYLHLKARLCSVCVNGHEALARHHFDLLISTIPLPDDLGDLPNHHHNHCTCRHRIRYLK